MLSTIQPTKGHVARLLLVLALLVGLLSASISPASAKQSSRTVDVQLLAINDFHGNLEPPTGSSARVLTEGGNVENTGGVEYLATKVKELRALNPNTLTVSAGDNIGASPLLSGYFHDEPTIEALNALGLDISAVGNHEFDEGSAELLRMQNGGCHPTDGCQDGDGFAGADFQYLSANVFYAGTNRTVFPAYTVRSFGAAKIAFIGLTLEGTPTIVTPAGVAGLEFRDEADTINALVPTLKKQGINSTVVLLHEGLAQTPATAAFTDTCNGPSGALIDIVARLNDAIDMVISGHTHNQYNCALPNSVGRNVPVSSASSFGRLVTKIDLKIDPKTKDIFSVAVDNRIVTRDVPKDPAETAIIAKYAAIVDGIRNAVIGQIQADLTRTSVVDESTLGNAIADGQLEAMTSFGAQFAVMNPGGIRADLICGPGDTPGACDVTFGEVFSVQPFQNDLVAFDLTGAQVDDVLEQQFDNPAAGQNRILSVSSNFTYQYDLSQPSGSRVPDASITLNGTPIVPATTYRLVANSFLSTGGDNFTVLGQGTNRVIGPVDSNAFADYVGRHSPVPVPALNRVMPVGP